VSTRRTDVEFVNSRYPHRFFDLSLLLVHVSPFILTIWPWTVDPVMILHLRHASIPLYIHDSRFTFTSRNAFVA